MSILRPPVLSISCFLNYRAVIAFERAPQFQQYHACFQMATQITFILNDPEIYETSSHITVLASFVANNFLAAIFISLSFQHYAFGISITTMATIYYAVHSLKYNYWDIAPIFTLISIICVFTAYQIELKDKKEFLDMKQTEVYQKDLKKVLQVLPEGVMVCQRFGNPHIKLWNRELLKLFKFASLPMAKGYTYGDTNGLNYESVDKEPKSDENLTFNNKVIENVDDLDANHLKEILSAKVLLPVKKIEEYT